ncbi:MAG: glycosyltransferase family 4 protein [Pseudomonadota bacterium]
MKLIYISKRLNSGDGSSVHGREFIKAASSLGHQVKSYPKLEEIRYDANYEKPQKTSVFEKIRKINFKNLNALLKKKSNYYRDFCSVLSGNSKSKQSARDLESIIYEFSPDVIVYRAVMYDFTPNIIRKKFRRKMIAEVNSIKSLEQTLNRKNPSTWIARRCEKLTYETSDAVVVVSNAIKDHLVEIGVRQPITVASNGVDLDTFSRNEEAKHTLKIDYGLQEKVVMGYVGSYKKWHNLDDSLAVLEQLVSENTNVHFVLIGSGAEEKRFNEQVIARGLESHVTKIPSLPHNEIPYYLNIIDIAVMTYPQMENFYFSPLKMYEYLAAGIPVVASRLGQIEEVMENAQIGKLVSPGDIANFSAAIKKLVNDETYRETIGKNAREWAENNCSWQVNAEKVLSAAETVDQQEE